MAAKLEQMSYELVRKQKCTLCFLYLSVGPVYVTKKHEKICGRCYTNGSFKNCAPSMYDVVSLHYLYKCVNHYEGCKSLLDVSETASHESICKIKKRCCLFCSFVGNWCQIIHHCEDVHGDQICWDGYFDVSTDENSRKTLLFPINDSIFVVTSLIENEKLRVTVQSEVLNDLVPFHFEIKYSMLGKTLSDFVLFDLTYNACFTMPIQELKEQFGSADGILKCQIVLCPIDATAKEMEIDKRFKNLKIRETELSNSLKELSEAQMTFKHQQNMVYCAQKCFKKLFFYFKCMKCLKFKPDELFFCERGHFYCSTCIQSYCIGCQALSEFVELPELNEITVSCDWELCNKEIPLVEYMLHMRRCSFRPYKCPLRRCEKILYSANKLVEHWHCKFPSLIQSKSIPLTLGSLQMYWLIHGNLYQVVLKVDSNKVTATIVEENILPNNGIFELWSKNPKQMCTSFSKMGNKFSLDYSYNTYNSYNSQNSTWFNNYAIYWISK